MRGEEENITGKKIKISDVICYVCALVFCSIPFLPFVDEMGMEATVVDGEVEIVSSIISHMVLTYMWYGYLPIIVAILIVVATITKKTWIRIVMMVADVTIAGFLIILANVIVAKIFEGDLYEPTVGYYLLIVAASVVLVVTLLNMSKEKNSVKN